MLTYTFPINAMHVLYTVTIRLTRRNEGVLDCIALGEVAQYIVCTLDEVAIQSSYIVNSSNGCCVFCSSLNSVHCTREGSANGFTTLRCPIVYPLWGRDSITVSTDEGELIWTVPSLELQGDYEGLNRAKHNMTYIYVLMNDDLSTVVNDTLTGQKWNGHPHYHGIPQKNAQNIANKINGRPLLHASACLQPFAPSATMSTQCDQLVWLPTYHVEVS